MRLVSARRITAGVLLLAAAHFAGVVLVPLVTAFFLALLADPLVSRIESRLLPRSISAFLVMMLFLSGIGLVGGVSYSASVSTLDQMPEYMARLKKIGMVLKNKTKVFQLDDLSEDTTLVNPDPNVKTPFTIPSDIQKVEVVEGVSSWFGMAARTLGSAFDLISLALFVPLFLFYFLVDKSDLLESLNTLTGRMIYLPKVNSDLPKMIRAFFTANLFGGVLLAILHYGLFFWLGIKNRLELSFITGLISLIPLIGAPIAIAFPLAQGLTRWAEVWPFVALISGILIFHFLVGNIVLPQIIGRRIDLNPASIILGLLFWGWLWGALGFLLAIPLTATLKILLENNLKTKALSNLLAAKPRHVVGLRRLSRIARAPPPTPSI